MNEDLHTMLAAATMALFITLMAIMMSSCKTIEVVKYIDREVVKTQLHHDSIYLHDSVWVDRYTKGDTIFIEKVNTTTKYVERLRVDTCLVRNDSIVVEQVITNKLNGLQKAQIRGFWVLLIALAAVVIAWLGKRFGWWSKIKALIKTL